MGKTEEEHLQNLSAKLQEAGLCLKKSKCYFMAESVEYLGHIIDATGLHPTKAKVLAMQNAPVPQDITQLKSFLGLINYYRKFLPDLSSLLAPLNRLLQKGTKWTWTDSEQTAAFDEAKSLPVHYDKRVQQPGESLNHYVTDLIRQARRCQYGSAVQ